MKNYHYTNKSLFLISNVIKFFALSLLIIFLIYQYFITNKYIFFYYFGFVPVIFSLNSFFTAVSYSFIHSSWLHLFLNLGILLSFGSILAKKLGSITFVIFWLISSVVCALGHYYLIPYSFIPLVGASGVLSAVVGGAARYGFFINERHTLDFNNKYLSLKEVRYNKIVMSFIVIWLLLNVSYLFFSIFDGFNNIATDVHLIGFIFGFFTIKFFIKLTFYLSNSGLYK
ncbi:rhomboid family intramembrane serine protease [Bartonella sp. DGB1]|uniref:rhomboid family intramembrane serine protease n=1 Tax=Bartonella sp. DGB1 TaxID=3239807 RepID=UPI0035245AFA